MSIKKNIYFNDCCGLLMNLKIKVKLVLFYRIFYYSSMEDVVKIVKFLIDILKIRCYLFCLRIFFKIENINIQYESSIKKDI